MEKRIFVDQKGREQLRRAFPQLSRISIWNALTYKTHSAIADKIRYVAVKQCGGVIRSGSAASLEWDTEHDEASRTMVQTYGDRFKLVLYKESDIVVLFVDGVEKRRDKHMTIPEYEALQAEVEKMAMAM